MILTLKEAEAVLAKVFNDVGPVTIDVSQAGGYNLPMDKICALVGHRDKILAIKLYRTLVPSAGLADAKAAVEDSMAKNPSL